MTTPRNPNPAPRAALRKAADATVHPAVGFTGAEPSRAETTAQRSHIAAVPAADQQHAVEGRGGADDQVRPLARPTGKGKKGKAAKRSTGRKFQGATSDVLRHPEPRERDILLGKQVTLQVQVPKRLRKAARAQAERQGTTIDEVVTGLLAGWVDGS